MLNEIELTEEPRSAESGRCTPRPHSSSMKSLWQRHSHRSMKATAPSGERETEICRERERGAFAFWIVSFVLQFHRMPGAWFIEWCLIRIPVFFCWFSLLVCLIWIVNGFGFDSHFSCSFVDLFLFLLFGRIE